MNNAKTCDAGVFMYDFEIEINATPEAVWDSLTLDTNAWWLPDFRMVAPDSTVTLEPRAGGQLLEQCDGGGSLLWYTVQYCQPDLHTIYLLGHLAPDFGGPSTSHLKLSMEAKPSGGSVFKVFDGIAGRIDESSIQSLKSGWLALFTDGLKNHIENK